MQPLSTPTKIALFGGTNGVGLECLKKMLSQNYLVTVLARNPSKISDIVSENLKVIQGNMLDPLSVDSVLKGNEVVLNALGTTKDSGVDICSKGTKILLDGMKKNGVKKIITCTSLGTGDSYQKCNWVSKFFIWAVISGPIADKVIQEDLIKASGLDYVIIRPSGLINRKFTGNYRVDYNVSGGTVARADVADWMVKQINSNEWVGKSPSITGN